MPVAPDLSAIIAPLAGGAQSLVPKVPAAQSLGAFKLPSAPVVPATGLACNMTAVVSNLAALAITTTSQALKDAINTPANRTALENQIKPAVDAANAVLGKVDTAIADLQSRITGGEATVASLTAARDQLRSGRTAVGQALGTAVPANVLDAVKSGCPALGFMLETMESTLDYVDSQLAAAQGLLDKQVVQLGEMQSARTIAGDVIASGNNAIDALARIAGEIVAGA